MNLTIKPKFISFFLYPALVNLLYIFLGVSITALITTFFSINIWIIAIICGGVVLLGYLFYLINLFIRYSKEQYIINENKILKFSGSIFESSSTEISTDKIISYFEYFHFIKSNFFNTKDLFIESEGTQSATILFSSVDIDELLQFNNFLDTNLQINNSESSVITPSFNGVFIDVIRSTWEVLYTLLIYVIFYGGIEFFLKQNTVSTSVLFFLGIYLLISIFGVGFRLAKVLLEIFSTKYFISLNSIIIEKGIFTRQYIFIPKNSLTDIKYYQEFWEKILRLKLAVLSIKNNPSFATLKYLPKSFELNLDIKKEDLDITNEEELVLKPNILRYAIDIFLEVVLLVLALVITYFYPPLFILILPGISFIYYISLQISEVFFTKYSLLQNKVIRNFSFLSAKTSIITPQNISSVEFSENFIDRLLKTHTITFFSLGGSESIRFSYIDKSNEVIEKVKTFVGFKENTDGIKLDSEINPKEFISASFLQILVSATTIIISLFIIYFFFPLYLTIIALLLTVAGVIFWSLDNYLSYKNSVLDLDKEFIYQEQGWWIRKTKITKSVFIKQISKTDYPYAKTGEINLQIAGSVFLASQSLFDNFFTGADQNTSLIKYVENTEEKVAEINEILFGSKVANVQQILKPDFLNVFIKIVLFSLVFPPLLLLLPYLFFRNKFRRFAICTDKIVEESGIFYKTKDEIYFKNIDYFEEKRDFVNKLVGNSQVLIFTSTNAQEDMVVGDISDTNFMKSLRTQ